MKSIKVAKSENAQKVTKVISNHFPALSYGALFKALRQKDIKINGARTKNDDIVYENDVVDVYISDNILIPVPKLDVVYEDDNLVVINKPQGLKVHPDNESNVNSVIDILRDKYGEGIYLCHRLDRNTGGLLMAAKNEATLDIVSNKIKKHEIRKIYRTRVFGKMPKKQEILTAYLDKDSRDSKVYINDSLKPGSSEIRTSYSVISFDRETNTSLLDIELITGKTHQIRAHMAYIGHPVAADGKYGTNELNKNLKSKMHLNYQALIAYKIIFSFTSPSGHLDYMKNMLLEIEPEFK